jgi:uncharacterized DUF497 family protein
LIFDWDDANRNHLVRHGITAAEAEQVLQRDPVELAVEPHDIDGERVRYVGETSNGRILIIIVTWRGVAVRVITGWDVPHSTKQTYLQHRLENHG